MESNELHIRIIRCFEIIERMNKAIDFHSNVSENEKDLMTIAQYVEIKGKIANELQILLNQLFTIEKISFRVVNE